MWGIGFVYTHSEWIFLMNESITWSDMVVLVQSDDSIQWCNTTRRVLIGPLQKTNQPTRRQIQCGALMYIVYKQQLSSRTNVYRIIFISRCVNTGRHLWHFQICWCNEGSSEWSSTATHMKCIEALHCTVWNSIGKCTYNQAWIFAKPIHVQCNASRQLSLCITRVK